MGAPLATLPVDVAPFREKYLLMVKRDEIDAYELARRLGYFKRNRKTTQRDYPDATRALRDLGLKSKQSGANGRHYVQAVVSTSKALKLCAALHMDPVDADF